MSPFGILAGSLHIFPESGFDQSAITPVLIGVLISWIFTETLGWVFAGLVVPGYAAALFWVDPRSAAIDVAEAMMTYVCARLLGEYLSRTGLTSRVFGRERFLLIVVVSVLVRVAFDGVVLAYLIPHSTWAYSVGLVLVPLGANACWKTGLWKGLVQNAVPTGIVYLLLALILIPHTNLSLAGFDLATENVAAAFIASPKTYVILLTGVVLAAVANIRYGWDYNGILIPALLALVVVNPLKLVATLAEVALLVLFVRILLTSTPMRLWNIEGPRRVVLFFTIDYAMRFVVAVFVGRRLPGTDIAAVTGFGYLLPTLIAVKAAQLGIGALVILPTLAVSLASYALGTMLGFTAQWLDDDSAFAREAVTRELGRAPMDPASAALWLSALARPLPARKVAGNLVGPERTARLARAAILQPNGPSPPYLDVQRLDGGVVLLREKFENPDHRLGDPAILLASRVTADPPVVAVISTPLRSPESAAVAGRLLALGQLSAVVVAGVEEQRLSPCEQSASCRLGTALAGPTGVVVTVIRSSEADGVTRVRWPGNRAAQLRPWLDAQSAILGNISVVTTADKTATDIVVELPSSAADLLWTAPPVRAESAASASSLALRFDELAESLPAAPVEDVLALQRLVLDPLLDADSSATPMALIQRAADMLGYQLSPPMPMANGPPAVMLRARAAPKEAALLVRLGGVRGLVVEVPAGTRLTLRRLAVRLGAALGADAVLMGLAPSRGLLANGTLAAAHRAATWPRLGRATRVVVVRAATGDPSGPGGAEVATWGGDDARRLATQVGEVLSELGIGSAAAPMPLAVGEAAGRNLFGSPPLVAITAHDDVLRSSSLAYGASVAAMFEHIATVDGECGDIARELVQSLESNVGVAPASLLEIARRAAHERSITALRDLEEVTASKAALSRIGYSATGVYLIVVGRSTTELLIGAFPVAMAADEREPTEASVHSVERCLATLARGGSCRVAERGSR